MKAGVLLAAKHKHVFRSYAVQRLFEARSQNPADLMASKIKGCEKEFDALLTPGVPFIVRLDGCSFKNYTHGLTKPFDARLTLAMIRTMNELAEHTGATLGFAQSDEISLAYANAPAPDGNALANTPFNGRIQKIASVFASLAAAKFNYYMGLFDWSNLLPKTRERLVSGSAFFDARVFSVADGMTAMEAIYWRHKYDCRRNAIHTLGISHFNHKLLNGLSLSQVVDLLAQEKGIYVHADIPKVFLYGTFAKKALVPLAYHNKMTGERGTVLRSRLENRVFDWKGTPESRVDMTLSKHWEACDPESVEPLEAALPLLQLSEKMAAIGGEDLGSHGTT